MKITAKSAPIAGGPERRTTSITIELAPDDDPLGLLYGLVATDRLADWLTAYARPGDHGSPASSAEALTVLEHFAYVHAMSHGRLEAMQLAARDQWGMGWGAIATAIDRPRATVKDQIQAIRARYADAGHWYDSAGLHTDTPARAETESAALWEADGRQPYADADDPDYQR